MFARTVTENNVILTLFEKSPLRGVEWNSTKDEPKKAKRSFALYLPRKRSMAKPPN